jgi:hypothetical protein
MNQVLNYKIESDVEMVSEYRKEGGIRLQETHS